MSRQLRARFIGLGQADWDQICSGGGPQGRHSPSTRQENETACGAGEQVDDLVNRAGIVQDDEHAAVAQQGPIQTGHRLPPVWYMPLFNNESADQVAQCFLGGDRAIDFGEAA
jgi:hypothetical protein